MRPPTESRDLIAATLFPTRTIGVAPIVIPEIVHKVPPALGPVRGLRFASMIFVLDDATSMARQVSQMRRLDEMSDPHTRHFISTPMTHNDSREPISIDGLPSGVHSQFHLLRCTCASEYWHLLDLGVDGQLVPFVRVLLVRLPPSA